MRTSNKIITVAVAVVVAFSGINLAVNYGIYKRTKPDAEALLKKLERIRVVDVQGMTVKNYKILGTPITEQTPVVNVGRSTDGSVRVDLGRYLSLDDFHIEGDTLIVGGGVQGRSFGNRLFEHVSSHGRDGDRTRGSAFTVAGRDVGTAGDPIKELSLRGGAGDVELSHRPESAVGRRPGRK